MKDSEGQQHVRAGLFDGFDENVSPSDSKLWKFQISCSIFCNFPLAWQC